MQFETIGLRAPETVILRDMSFWFYGRKRNGRRSLYSVSLPIFVFPMLLAVLAAILVALIRGCGR